MSMTNDEMQEIGSAYARRFGNLDELAMSEIMFEPAFINLLQKALASGKKLEQADVEAVFPEVSWEW
jgi:hypothetical protein